MAKANITNLKERTLKTEVEVLESNFSKLRLSTINSGFQNERSRFNISGRVKLNSVTKIGTISFSAKQQSSGDSMRYITSPNLVDLGNSGDNNVFFKFNSTTEDSSGNIIGYLFDVMYDARDGVNIETLNYEISENLVTKLSDRTGISGVLNIELGDRIVVASGERRKVRITGSEGTTVPIVITQIADVKNSAGDILSFSETSLLPEPKVDSSNPTMPVATSSRSISAGSPTKDYPQHTFTIPKKGFVEFYINFPVQTTETRYSFKFKAVELQSRSNINLANLWLKSTYVNAQRDNIPQGWDDYYMAELIQHMNPILTLKTITTWSNATVDTTSSGTYVTFNNGNPILKTYTGRYNKRSSEINSGSVAKSFLTTHVFKASSGAFALRSGSDGSGGTLGAPVYSIVSGEESDWTNSRPLDDDADGFVGNGGTILEITGISVVISTTSSSNDTLTLKYYVDIEKWGTKDVTMQLNVDHIATLS